MLGPYDSPSTLLLKKECVLIYSGGMDSTTLLHKLWREGLTIRVLIFDYGQRHKVEVTYAQNYCDYLVEKGAKISTNTLPLFLNRIMPGSSQTDASVSVPTGHYQADSMKLTVVPNRNMIMLAIAAGHAMANGIEDVYFGAHGGDHAIYPDCRPEFVAAMNEVVGISHWTGVTIHAPFLKMDKGYICRLGSDIGVEFERTWTCYDPVLNENELESPIELDGAIIHCGKCGSCNERKEAFQKYSIPDPTFYNEV